MWKPNKFIANRRSQSSSEYVCFHRPQVHHGSSRERTNLGVDERRKTSRAFPRMEKEGVDFMQRPCNDQGTPGVCLSMHLSVVRWTRTKYFWQGNNFIRWSQEMGDTSQKGGRAMQTQREQTSRGHTVQSTHSRWYGITRVHRKVQANHWCMGMTRRREGHGSQERYSPRSKESKSLSKVFGRRPGLAYRRTSGRNCNSLVQQRLTKINYADSQYSNCSSNCNAARINTDSQSASKASKKAENQRSGQIETRRRKIKRMVRQKDKVVFVVEQSLLTPDRSVRPRMLQVTSVERKEITKSAARAKQVNKVQLVNLGRFRYMVYKHHWQELVPIRLQFVILHRTTWCLVHIYHRITNTQCFTIFSLFMWRVLMILQASTSSLFG